MFAYRQELRRHFFAIVIPNVTISIGSLFGYPALCKFLPPLPPFQHKNFQHKKSLQNRSMEMGINKKPGYAIGISSTRSLAFAGRSLTLALATPATKNLGGDVNTVCQNPLSIQLVYPRGRFKNGRIGPWEIGKMTDSLNH